MPPPPRSAFPFFLLFARVVAAPGFFQLVRAPVPLLFQALFGLPGLPPLPPLAVALGAAVRHAGPPLWPVRPRRPDGRGDLPRVVHGNGISSCLQISRAVMLSISRWRGTVVCLPVCVFR